ncbi:MAG: hypothetical protein QOH81_505 [Sphingomonadales bacterium]|jgi:hypothetical protein|nr:hypothetical protein [Sphingomonadales bacterium]
MMGMFEYVIVLSSIVIGLALTHLMQGVASLVQHPGRTRIWWVHLLWVAHLFLTTVFWWWWEFRLHTIQAWTFQLYFFVIFYAFFIYLICAVAFPRDLDGYEGYRDYLLDRRGWFFGLLIAWLLIDFFDTWAKGSKYFASLGLEYPIAQTALVILCFIGTRTRREAIHGAIVILVLGYQILRIARFYDTVS